MRRAGLAGLLVAAGLVLAGCHGAPPSTAGTGATTAGLSSVVGSAEATLDSMERQVDADGST